MSKLQLNPAFDPAEFLSESWQQRPLFLPQLLPGFGDLVSPEELAGLACEDVIESRLVTESTPGRWQLQHGPFDEAVFTSLPDSRWTVLIQAVDQWVDAVAELRALFEFIPRWRIDDVMISYAADQGGVGPHFDHYDVFLLQGSGQRRWQVGNKVPPGTALDNQDGVGILRNFSAAQEFVMNPGDALYLPPQYAHWGQSLGPSTCYSIGFRAPALDEMLAGFSDFLIQDCQPHERYVDTAPRLPAHPSSLDPDALSAAFQMMQAKLQSPSQFARWFGSFVTQRKYPELREPLAPPLQLAQLRDALAAGARLAPDPAARFAFLQPENAAGMLLFADGEGFALPQEYNDIVPKLCSATDLNTMDFSHLKKSDPLLAILLHWLNQGTLQLH